MKRLRKQQLVIALIAVVCVAAAAVVWTQRHRTKPPTSSGMGPSHQSETSTAPAENAQSSGAPSPAQTPSSPNSSGSSASTTATPPPKPTGQITNNYPNPVGYNDNIETSCQTVPGATCDVQITGPTGQTKLLGAKMADQAGAVLFEWKPSQTGVAPGSWKLALVATKNGASSLGDSYNLTVNP